MLKELVTYLEQNQCAQIVVRRGDQTIIDHQFVDEPVDVAAVQKSLISLMIGIAQQEYLLETVDHVNHHVDPEWTRLSPWDEAKLNIEHLLTMTTGMNEALELEGEIGKTWAYNNVAWQQLKKILCLHTSLSLNELTRGWVLEPLGMTRTDWRDRDAMLPNGEPFTALYSTANDLASLGQIFFARGQPLLKEAHYFDQLNAPGSIENPAWGFMWWNNDQARYRLPYRDRVFEGPPVPEAPSDLIAARGARGNHLGVSVETQTLVACTMQSGAHGNLEVEREIWRCISDLHQGA